MRIKIQIDEKWPIYSVIDADGDSSEVDFGRVAMENEIIDVPDELGERFIRVQQQYEVVQAELQEIFDRIEEDFDNGI